MLKDALRTFALYKQYAMALELWADGKVLITNVAVRTNHRPTLDIVYQIGSCTEKLLNHYVPFDGRWYQVAGETTDLIVSYFSSYLTSSLRFLPIFVGSELQAHMTGLLFDKQNGTVEYFDSNGLRPAYMGPGMCFSNIVDRLSFIFDKYMKGKSRPLYSDKMMQQLLPDLRNIRGLCQPYTLAFFRMRVFENKTFEQTIDELLDRSHMGTSKAVADQIFNSFFAKTTKRRRRRK